MYDLDDYISNALPHPSVVYTRYADDITFSAPRAGYLRRVHSDMKSALKQIKNPSLKMNENKRVFATEKYKRMITGLILANDGRVTIGRSRKHLVRAQMQHALLGKLSDKELAALSGMLAFINDVEPDWFAVIKQRYGTALIELIKRHGGRE